MQGFGEKGTPSEQRYEHPFLVVAYCDPADEEHPSIGKISMRVKRHDGRTRIRGAIFYEPDFGTCDRVVFNGSLVAVAEYIICNSHISKVYDTIGTRDNPVSFPSQGLDGIAWETRDLADGFELTATLVCPSVKGRYSLTACLVPDQRMTMEEWHALSVKFNVDAISALRLGGA
jgi:hypothetical protein